MIGRVEQQPFREEESGEGRSNIAGGSCRLYGINLLLASCLLIISSVFISFAKAE